MSKSLTWSPNDCTHHRKWLDPFAHPGGVGDGSNWWWEPSIDGGRPRCQLSRSGADTHPTCHHLVGYLGTVLTGSNELGQTLNRSDVVPSEGSHGARRTARRRPGLAIYISNYILTYAGLWSTNQDTKLATYLFGSSRYLGTLLPQGINMRADVPPFSTGCRMCCWNHRRYTATSFRDCIFISLVTSAPRSLDMACESWKICREEREGEGGAVADHFHRM